tara:strand:+ start:219 stop:365 length:147 start_codon:yes stop_codon:yes gene_type:complete
MHTKLNHNEYNAMMEKVGKTYLPPEKKKKKLTMKQVFIIKGKRAKRMA